MFKIELCKTKENYSVRPLKRMELNLSKIRGHFNIAIYTPIALVIKDKYEIIVHKYGEIIFKNCNNKKEIEKIAKKIYSIGAK